MIENMKQNKLIPELRFPEFNGEWEEKILEEVSEINPSNKKLPNSFYYIDLESDENVVLLKKQYIELNKAPSRAQRLLQNGDIIYQTVRPYQKNNYHFFHNVPYRYVASTGYA